jgi:alkylated DNA nucleotide flippase Atl1
MKKKTAWEKLKCGKQPKIVEDYKDGRMLVSTPEEVESFVAKIPAGHVITLSELRNQLAHAHGADLTCAMSTAIFLNVVARAHAERETETGKPGVPWWRVLRANGSLNDKFPGGAAEQARRLRLEGLDQFQPYGRT